MRTTIHFPSDEPEPMPYPTEEELARAEAFWTAQPPVTVPEKEDEDDAA